MCVCLVIVEYCGILWISKVSVTFTCEPVVNNLRENKFFLAQMNRNHFDFILARNYRNCSTMENLRCLNSSVSAANELILLKQFGAARKLFLDKVKTALETRKRWTSTKIIMLKLSEKLRLYPNSMIQTREKRDSLVLSRADF